MDTTADTIRYTTTRQIEPDEELCIFYGRDLWFSPDDTHRSAVIRDQPVNEVVDGWASLSTIEPPDDTHPRRVSPEADPSEIIPEQDLPFTMVKITPDEEEEEEPNAIRTSACCPNIPILHP
jgi:tRNA-specific adenosine deaminase 3